MRLKVVVEQTYMLNVRGHGPGAVRELERLRLEDALTIETLAETSIRFETLSGDFSYELASPLVSALPLP